MAAMLTIVLMLVLVVIVYLMPRKLKTKMIFYSIYKLYLTRVGLLYHKRQLAKYKVKVGRGKVPSRKSKVVNLDGVTIHVIPFLYDNLAYLVVDNVSNTAFVVDPAGPNEVMNVLNRADVTVQGILCTHKHWDHAGGNGTLKSKFPDVAVYCTRIDSAYKLSHPILNGDRMKFGSLVVEAVFTPGHTEGHMTYKLLGNDKRPPCVFTGDHVFVGGCGQIFETKPCVMLDSLDVVANMHPDSLLFPGHDYALANMQFVTRVAEPNNLRAQEKLKSVSLLASQQEPAVPSVLGEELEYNPFLRVNMPSIRISVSLSSSASDSEVLLELRRRKNQFSNQPIWF